MVGKCSTETAKPDYSEYVKRLVDEAPPLTDRQIATLRALLRPAVAKLSAEATR